MRFLTTICLLFTFSLSFGQGKKPIAYQLFPDQSFHKKMALAFPVGFTNAGSGVGWTLKLEKDSSFTFFEHVDCSERITVATGKWTIGSSKLQLTAPAFTRAYSILFFNGYSFLVEQQEKQTFLKEFQALKNKFNSDYHLIYLGLQDTYLHGMVQLPAGNTVFLK